MNKQDLFNLVHNCGVLTITAHELNASDAYKIVKFRRAIQSAYKELQEAEQAILDECGIENPSSIPTDKMERFTKMLQALRQEKLTFDESLCLSYESWHALQNENRNNAIGGKEIDVLVGYAEDVLENILWKLND